MMMKDHCHSPRGVQGEERRQVPLHDENRNARISLGSFKHLFGIHRTESESRNISASANTHVMSNIRRDSSRDCASPPNCINDEDVQEGTGRSIFGSDAKKKYNVRNESGHNMVHPERPQHSTMKVEPEPFNSMLSTDYYSPINGSNKRCNTPPRTPCTPDESNPHPIQSVGCHSSFLSPNMSPLTPAAQTNNKREYTSSRYYMARISDAGDESSTESAKEYGDQFDTTIRRYDDDCLQKDEDRHHHAQALLLSMAFFFIWTPQNLLAPNLSQAAEDFGYTDEHDRDLYLGSNLALATSVLSLPVSACIGFASDLLNRRILISVTTFVGGASAIGCGLASTYPQLVLGRFISGSCMSGCVPVVFSLLSDWFDDKDRNAASSGFTAMMGAGILLGQVYGGFTGDTLGWRHSFFASGILTILFAGLVILFIDEPVRGGKEKVLQEMMERGGKYAKKLTWSQFVSSMTNHSSNCLLLLQGFFSNLPWGVMFCFLNDFLSQEKGLSVKDATGIVAVFGIGCAIGGILGGFLGSLASQADRRYLPLFMAITTLVGVLPFLALLNDTSYNHAGLVPCFYAFTGGCLASMPSVNVRPCIINVNPPEIRGAQLTSANLVINLARGCGPSFLTAILMGMFGLNRKDGFNVTIICFWTLTAIQLGLLAKTLPSDQEKMETELAQYASSTMDMGYGSISVGDNTTRDGIESYFEDATFADGDRSLYSIDNQASSFDVRAARQSLEFVGEAMQEIGNITPCGGTRRRRRLKQPLKLTTVLQSQV